MSRKKINYNRLIIEQNLLQVFEKKIYYNYNYYYYYLYARVTEGGRPANRVTLATHAHTHTLRRRRRPRARADCLTRAHAASHSSALSLALSSLFLCRRDGQARTHTHHVIHTRHTHTRVDDRAAAAATIQRAVATSERQSGSSRRAPQRTRTELSRTSARTYAAARRTPPRVYTHCRSRLTPFSLARVRTPLRAGWVWAAAAAALQQLQPAGSALRSQSETGPVEGRAHAPSGARRFHRHRGCRCRQRTCGSVVAEGVAADRRRPTHRVYIDKIIISL